MLMCVAISVGSSAAEFDCGSLNEELNQYGHRPYIGEVIERGRTQFYSAPDARCPIKDKFIIHKDRVFVYTEYEGFYRIMYPEGTEEDSGVWVYSNRIKIVAKPDEIQNP